MLSIIFSSLSGCRNNADKFDWLATESAPKKYPMEIVRGFLIAPDGFAQYIPYGSYINLGWGEMNSSHIGGPDLKPLPDRLEIAFFSWTENTFYQGSFDLPYEKILELFQSAYQLESKNELFHYRRIMVGVAPGGVVSVWVKGTGRITEVFYGHAEKVDMPWETILDNPDYTREEVIVDTLEEALGVDGVQELKEKGIPFGLWDRYRKTYPWQLAVHSEIEYEPFMYVDFHNGEQYYLELGNILGSKEFNRLPVPESIHLYWSAGAGQTYTTQLDFDDKEVLEAFEVMAGPDDRYIDQPLSLDVYFQEEGNRRTISAGLSRGDEKIIFEKMSVEAFRKK